MGTLERLPPIVGKILRLVAFASLTVVIINPLAALAAAETWTLCSPIIYSRYFHTATLLPNGQVLVAGGFRFGNDLNRAEIFDPASRIFHPYR